MMTNSKIRSVIFIGLLAFLGCIIYSNSLKAPFLFDDKYRIQENPHMRMENISPENILKAAFGKQSPKNRPVGNITFALNYFFHGDSPEGYHIVNIGIHVLAAIFLFFFIKTSLTIPAINKNQDHPDVIALASALLWLVHPLHTQSVTYIVQRLNSMAAMFYVLSFWLYVKGQLQLNKKGQRLYVLGAVLSWMLALGSKQIAITLPVFVFLYHWYFFKELDLKWLRAHLKYVMGVLILLGIISLIYLGAHPVERMKSFTVFSQNEFTYLERLLTQPRVVLFYLSLCFWPHPSRLNLAHDFPLSRSLIDPPTTFISIFIVGALAGFAFFLAKKNRPISFCIFWFLGNLLLESSFLPLAVIFEHRTYLPTMLLAPLLVVPCLRRIKPEWLGYALICTIVATFSYWTYERNNVWKDEIAFWEDCIKKSSQKAELYYNLANALQAKGDRVRAIDNYAVALRLNPDYTEAHVNIGNALSERGMPGEAIKHYAAAVRLDPKNSKAYNNLATELAAEGRLAEAISYLSQAVALDAANMKARQNLEKLLSIRNRIEAAISEAKAMLDRQPDDPELNYNLANLYRKMGVFDRAVHYYRQALSLQPDFAPALYNLVFIFMKQEKFDKALAVVDTLIALEPAHSVHYYNAAQMYARLNRVEDALRMLRQAIQKGFRNWDLIKADPDLENIRNTQEYRDIIKAQDT